MKFRKPNCNGPRFRTSHKEVLTKELFMRFIEKYPDYSHIDCDTFKKVVKKDNEKISKIIIEERDGLELRESLGNIFVTNCDSPAKSHIDYGESIKTGKLVVYKDWDSDNRLAKIIYTNCGSRHSFQNRNLWKFKGVRQLTRGVSVEFRKNYTKYIQIDSNIKISSLIK